ncbi:hypothetical protein TWF730_003884 [Orbilia blumenaviensis]|uniref:DRBM domain-containing protein n=1 Tax=Orbilia blumenaviensis TaxID=1796055 RepID=A0AAV9U2R8_9PEZI
MESELAHFHTDTEELPINSAASHNQEATSPGRNNESQSVDSGYFSRDSITAKPKNAEVQSQDRIIVTQDPISRSSKSFPGIGFFAKSKQPELVLFRDAEIPDEFYSRFQDLVQLYDRPLKSKLKPKFMAWKVKVFGEDENSKRPYIVILCDAGSTKKLTKFFSKKEIKQQCEGTENLPPLPVLVITSAPTRVSADIPNVFGREEVYLGDTNCGESIKIVHDGKAKMATLGGILKVVYHDGATKLYGMTAGHIVDEDTFNDEESIGDLSEGSESEAESEDESSSEASSVSTTVSSLDIHVPTEDGGCNFGWTKIGKVVKPTAPIGLAIHGTTQLAASTSEPEHYNLDWSLIELVDDGRKKMNLITRSIDRNDGPANIEVDHVYFRRYGDATGRRVLYQPGTEPGYLNGTINTKPAFMHQSPSNKMARVYNMTWDSDQDQVSVGDCGSWVLDHTSAFKHALYGHIIAVDIFDEAYIVPFEDTIRQMANHLNAQSIELPVKSDIEGRLLLDDNEPMFTTTEETLSGEAICLMPEITKNEDFSSLPPWPMPVTADQQLQFKRILGDAPISRCSTPTSCSDQDVVQWLFEPIEKPLATHEYLLGATNEPVTQIQVPLQASISQTPTLTAHSRDYATELVEYCDKFDLKSPTYRHNEVAVPNKLNIRSLSTVYIEGILYGASLWDGMHTSIEEADQFASREALRNLVLHHQRLLFEDVDSTKPKLEKPTEIVSEATMNKYRQKQLEILLPKIVANTRGVSQREQPLKTSLQNQPQPPMRAEFIMTAVAQVSEGRKDKTYGFNAVQEQDIPAGERLKRWFVAARKRHPAETIETLLNKQCDLEDDMSDAKYSQLSIQQEIRKLDDSLRQTKTERESILAYRELIALEIKMLKNRLEIIKLNIEIEREKEDKGYLVPGRLGRFETVRSRDLQRKQLLAALDRLISAST